MIFRNYNICTCIVIATAGRNVRLRFLYVTVIKFPLLCNSPNVSGNVFRKIGSDIENNYKYQFHITIGLSPSRGAILYIY